MARSSPDRSLLQSLRSLIVPIVIGGTLGPAAVGIVSLAVRLVENLSMGRTVIARIAVPLLARLVCDRPRLLATMQLGIEVQTAGRRGSGRAVFARCRPTRPVALRLWMGRDSTDRHPSRTVGNRGGDFLAEQPAPDDRGETARVARRPSRRDLLAWITAAVAIPRFGIAGFACAELAAAAAWLIPARMVQRSFGAVSYSPALVWAGAASLAALAPLAGWWLLLPLPALALHRATRQAVRAAMKAVSGSASGSSDGRAATG